MVNYNKLEWEKQQGKPDILMIYTGGTLGMVYDPKLKTLIPLRFDELLAYLPELGRVEANITVLALEPPIDSSDMNPKLWVELAAMIAANYQKFDAFVILHGTDTMAYSASALSFLLENLQKPVILTGAQLPLGMARTDARENIITALEIAVDYKHLICEVCIYFNGRLLRGNRSTKYESTQFDAFHSENYPLLAEVGVYCEFNHPYLMLRPEKAFKLFDKLEEHVLILKLFPGMKTEMLEGILTLPGLKGVVLETFGSGNASSSTEFLEILAAAIKRGVVIVNVSQCSGGMVRQKDYATGRGLEAVGVISGNDMTTEAALTKLMFLLSNYSNTSDFKKLIAIEMRGELTVA